MHTSLKYIMIKQLVPENYLEKISGKINIMNNFCISDQLAVSSSHMLEKKPTKGEKMIDCCNKNDLNIFKENLESSQGIHNVDNQTYSDNPYEIHIKKSLDMHFEKYL